MVVADVGVYQLSGGADGGGGSAEDEVAASTRLQTQDDFDITNLTHPIPIPGAGFNYSYWIHVYLKIENFQDAAQINNIQLYCDGGIDWTHGGGGELRMGHKDGAVDQGVAMDADYEVATGDIGVTGHTIEDAVNGHSFYSGEAVKTIDIEGYVTDARCTLDTTNHVGAGKTKAAVFQEKLSTVGDGAVQGLQADEEIVLAYDEI